jgi:hypothetical protein
MVSLYSGYIYTVQRIIIDMKQFGFFLVSEKEAKRATKDAFY